MYLDPCTLGRIFRGNISTWNDPAIVSLNPDLPDLATMSQAIRIVHRNPRSSSTYALTNYLSKACPQEWNAVNPGSNITGAGPNNNRQVGTTTNWPDDTPGRWQTVENSQQMVEQIAAVPYSFGYVESGQGLLAGLQEVAISNANGTRLVSEDAEVASEAFINEQFPLSDLGNASWINVNPVFASPGNPNQWPMTLGTYFYVYQNLTFLQQSGGLLLQFLNYMLSDDVAAIMHEYGFVPLPSSIRKSIVNSLNTTLVIDSSVKWITELATTDIVGQGNFVFSKRRDSYLMNTMAGLTADNSDAKRTLMLGDAYQVHGSGSFVSAMMIRQAMQVLSGRARVPISMTYRAVGSIEAQAEFSDYRNMYKSYNHFKVADMPLDSATWTTLTSQPAAATTVAVLQLPIAVSALGIYYNKALPSASLTLNCALLARLYTADLSSWSDPDLVSLNKFSEFAAQTLLNHTVTVFAMAQPSGPTWALTGYLAKACGSAWPTGQRTSVSWASGVTTSYQGSPIVTPDDMLKAIAGTPNSIGYIPATLGSTSGLASAQFVVEGVSAPLRLSKANLTTVITQARATSSGLFSNVTADLMANVGLSLYGLSGTWPMPMVQYVYLYRNLSGYGYSGPLLRALVEYLLSPEGSQLASSAGLAPMPEPIQATMRTAVSLSILKTLTVVWGSEPAGTYDGSGSGLYTFSANRLSYEAQALSALQQDVAAVKGRLALALPVTLRVACTPGILGLTRLLQRDLQDMASTSVRILDEMLPAPNSVTALRAAITGSSAPTHLVVHPGPLLKAQWVDLARSAAIVQTPVAIRPVAVVYKGVAGLRLSACTLAKIIRGDVRFWDDASIQEDNPSVTLARGAISLLQGGADDADARAVLEYVLSAAPAGNCSATSGLKLPTTNLVPNEDIIARLAATENSYTALGFVAAAGLVSEAADGAGLQAVKLQSVATNTYVTPMQLASGYCPPAGCADAVSKVYMAAVEDIMANSLKVISSPNKLDALRAPLDYTGDWSEFSLLSACCGIAARTSADVYPIFRFDFLVGLADLTKFGDDGPAVRAAVEYATGAHIADRINGALGPYFVGLGERARAALAVPALAAMVTSPDQSPWTIVASSTEQAGAVNPAATIVISRAPSLSGVALPGAALYPYSTTVNTSSAGDIQVIAQQAALSAISDVRTDQDRLDLVYNIGVAALVLALVLSLTALVLAVIALAKIRSSTRTTGGCLTPATKYEAHTDAPGNVEMQVAGSRA
ncbi:hypothetical protein GPECTOR_34g717 [Gonium pectorale]|uniref:PBP domain-containing protein n=1 Tax=Gonium pectorale TaxID=33097 RepID=A0A150GCL0_GONPE|nr:hypothetical protein GPECTOR_34g717 [Gonium pectorale]|eukprot:KXZ47558.1 hypothetical protein GPECTOR_34g717 [Gonium pectorale]